MCQNGWDDDDGDDDDDDDDADDDDDDDDADDDDDDDDGRREEGAAGRKEGRKEGTRGAASSKQGPNTTGWLGKSAETLYAAVRIHRHPPFQLTVMGVSALEHGLPSIVCRDEKCHISTGRCNAAPVSAMRACIASRPVRDVEPGTMLRGMCLRREPPSVVTNSQRSAQVSTSVKVTVGHAVHVAGD